MATKDEKFSLNISLDLQEDREIIEYFKQGGKRVDLLRSAMKFYFDNERGFSDAQEEEINRLIKKALDNISVNINTSNVVINSEHLQTTAIPAVQQVLAKPVVEPARDNSLIKSIADQNGIDFL